ncbi:MAG: Rpn family recombination-promoting nuclease/putative transposase [Clostridiales bacterium]|nr:Rpn family recombination-promoting nuclease/putative transposase [Clostridiales bacterium]
MGRIDVLTKNYMKNKKIFADAFNYYIYDGRQVIDPDKLREIDAAAVTVPYGEDGTSLKTQPVHKIRDSFCAVMADDEAVYMLLGIENQTENHFAMPVKNMLYDAMEYAAQVQEAARSHRKAGNYGNRDEFLSGFHKSDRLVPVVTLVIYWGDGEWTGPKSLHDMMDTKNEAVLRFVSNYEINLIVPNELSYEEAEKFASDLGKALMYIKNMQNKNEIKRMITDNRYRTVECETGILLSEIMNFEYHLPKNEEVADMCYAIEMIKKEAVEEAVQAERKAAESAIEIIKKEAVEEAVQAERKVAEEALHEERKAAEEALHEERKAGILYTIELCRDFNMAEDDIEKKITNKYGISKEDARWYMLYIPE